MKDIDKWYKKHKSGIQDYYYKLNNDEEDEE